MHARHAEAIATVRAFSERSGALRVVLLVDRDTGTAMVECGPGGVVEITEGDRNFEVPADVVVDAAPRGLADIRSAPPASFSFDAEAGRLEAPIGAVANLGDAVLALARAFGGRSVATAEFATRDPGLPLTIAAREGEPLVIAAGDRRFVLRH